MSARILRDLPCVMQHFAVESGNLYKNIFTHSNRQEWLHTSTMFVVKSYINNQFHPSRIEDSPLFLNLNLLLPIFHLHLDFMVDGTSQLALPLLPSPAILEDDKTCSGKPVCVLCCVIYSHVSLSHYHRPHPANNECSTGKMFLFC